MHRLLVIPMVLTVALLSGGIGANAAASAQIVNCAATTWCFSPNPITVPVGSAVMWSNGTAAPHTATSNTGAWTTGTIVPGASSGAITFNSAGTFAYHCAIHPFMTGTLIVTAAVTATPTVAPTTAPTHGTTPSTTRSLARTGVGPILPIALGLVLLGVGLLTPAGLRRRPRGR
ncbi:MAG: cupredoxin domain-containing protein [Candidatus Dormibacteraeota bacterium]|nr:cupredoxin domain-containing protein [Candidatus Dormibacteraeota bacterium]